MSAPSPSSRIPAVLTGLVTALAVGTLTFLLLADAAGGAGALLGRTGPGSAVPRQILGAWEVRKGVNPPDDSAESLPVFVSVSREDFEQATGRNRLDHAEFSPNQAVLLIGEEEFRGEGFAVQLVTMTRSADRSAILIYSDQLSIGIALQPDPDRPGMWRFVTSSPASAYAMSRPGTIRSNPAPARERRLIRGNLRHIASVAQEYMLAQSVTEVAFTQIPAPDPFSWPPTSVRGERYDGLVISQTQNQIYVEAPGLGTVSYEY